MRAEFCIAALLTVVAPGAARAAPPAGNVTAGKSAFAACASCHQVGPAARNGLGPPLNGIVGRRAGTAQGFGYSPAMRRSEIVWSDDTLAAFIRRPDAIVPGTSMRFNGWLFGDQKVADLLAYLRSLPEAR